MELFKVFITIVAWLCIAFNTLVWAAVIHVIRKYPHKNLQAEFGWLDAGTLLSICWLLAVWVTR